MSRKACEETAMTTESPASNVSSALKDTKGDLVKTISTVGEQWASDQDTAKTKARDLHSAVLNERQSLQESLGTAARLWGVLHTSGASACNLGGTTTEQREAAIALRNVTQTLQFLDFFEGVPSALEDAHSELLRIIDGGTERFVAGNASSLYNVHAMLSAVERVRDMSILEGMSGGEKDGFSAPDAIARAEETRKMLDIFLMEKVFGDILNVSQTNPRFLVAAIRIVLQEEQRDAWWKKHLASRKLGVCESVDDVFSRRNFKKRFFEAVGNQIDEMFVRMGKRFCLNADIEEGITPGKPSTTPNAEAVLEWLNCRIADNELVHRFVAPCLPSNFGISAFYEAKLHHRMMTTLLALLRKITECGTEDAQQDSMMKFMLWYSSYREGVGSDYSGINSYLDDRDRQQLVRFMREHVAKTVGDEISSVLDADVLSCRDESAGLSQSDVVAAQDERSVLGNIGEGVFGTINELVGRAATLGVSVVQKAVAIAVAESLHLLQSKFAQMLDTDAEQPVSVKHAAYVCSVANNMAGCLELAEELRDNLSSLFSDDDRIEVVSALKSGIEGFRSIAMLGLGDLARGVEHNLRSLTCKLYAPHTGTEVILDIIGTLDDSFQNIGKRLLAVHFEQLASECLRSVVAYYITPFLLLGQTSGGQDGAKKNTISPDDMAWIRSRSQSKIGDRAELVNVRSRQQRVYNGSAVGLGLMMMNSTAVVAQIDKDMENLAIFFQAKVELYQRKQFQAILEPIHAIRALYTCPPTPVDLVEAYQVAKLSVRNAMIALAPKCGPIRHSMSVRVAEAIWCSRPDLNASVRDEAVLYSSEQSSAYGFGGRIASAQRDANKRNSSVSSRFSVDTWSPSVSVQKRVFSP